MIMEFQLIKFINFLNNYLIQINILKSIKIKISTSIKLKTNQIFKHLLKIMFYKLNNYLKIVSL
jgi:hypothetical protein